MAESTLSLKESTLLLKESTLLSKSVGGMGTAQRLFG